MIRRRRLGVTRRALDAHRAGAGRRPFPKVAITHLGNTRKRHGKPQKQGDGSNGMREKRDKNGGT